MIWFGLLLTLIAFWTVIYPITDYWTRWFNPRVLKKGSTREPKICLTFDDGPNPEITPRVLDILAQDRIPATFFLVGRRALNNPELVREILKRGHRIGVHTHHHMHAYRMFYKKSIATIGQAKLILEQICGGPVCWFRPPWGALNLFQYLAAKRLELTVVLWTANAVDWERRTTPAQIVARLVKKLKPGCIIVIHDAGGEPGAPQNMVEALPEIIKQCQIRGYHFVTLADI
jgi:peptidoglycan-N-acetylglucosamine deacetylase